MKATDIIPILKLVEKYALSAMGIGVIILSARLYRSGFYKPSTIFICIAGINAFLWKFVFLTYGESELTEMLSEIFEVSFGVFTALGVLAYVSSIYTEYSKALQRSEEHFRSLIENAQDTITIVNGDGTIRYASPSVERVLRYKPEESIGKNIAEFIHPEDASDVTAAITYAGQNPGNNLSTEYRVKHKDGSWRIFEGKGKSFLDDAGVAGVVINARDITERKQAGEELFKTKQQLQYLISNSPAVIYTCKSSGDYGATFISEKVTSQLGYEPREFTENSHFWADHIHPEDAPHVFAELARLFELGYHVQEYRFLHKDGTYKWMHDEMKLVRDEAGKPHEIVGFWIDITERKQAEEKQRESEERYRMLVEHSPDAIAVQSEGRIIFVNPAGTKLLGASDPEQLVGKPITDFVHPDYQETIRDRIRKMREEGKDVPLTEEKFIRLDGKIIDVEVEAMPLTYIGKPAIQVIFRDITEKKIAREIRLENERLAYASKSKSDFLATMSHELRTPLNSIIGFSELLRQKIFGELNEKQERHVDNILISGKFLLSLIDDILDLTKIEAGKMELIIEMFEISSAINEVTTLIKEGAKKNNIVLKKELDPQLDFIEADKRKFKQILFNLLDNAIKFSKPEGGTVAISAKKEGDIVRFSISDTGIGIKEEDMPKLFKKFQQIDSGITRKYGGAGLGLVISKELVELLGGKITVKSKYGEGSTFAFSMPMVAKRQVRLNDKSVSCRRYAPELGTNA